MSSKTMNTHLHILEAYTNFYKVWPDDKLSKNIEWLIRLFVDRIYDYQSNHFKVYCNDDWESLIDAISYGHDIEASWLLDEAAELIKDMELRKKVFEFDRKIAKTILNEAFENNRLFNEKIKGKIDKSSIWWVEAEALVGFLNAYLGSNNYDFLEATFAVWGFIKDHLIDKRQGSEWYWKVDEDLNIPRLPIVEPWKCPYHNGRMCFEAIKRIK